MQIEQRYVISFLHRQKFTCQQISTQLKLVYGADSYCLKTVQYWVHELILGRTNLHEVPVTEKPKDEWISTAVKSLIEYNPYLSARKIAKVLGISPTTVVDRLSLFLGYKCYCTRWIPHQLSYYQMQNRHNTAKFILPVICSHAESNFANIITGDESWFLYEYTQSTQWVLSKDDLLDRVTKTNMQRKLMVTIFFNGEGPVCLDFKPKDRKFNSDYFIDIIDKIHDTVFPDGREENEDKKIIHFDNARCHTSQKVKEYLENSDFIQLPHPPYSPDIAPSDFGLFGTIKQKMPSYVNETEDDLKNHITEIVYGFGTSFWESLFYGWITRLEEVIRKEGDYIT